MSKIQKINNFLLYILIFFAGVFLSFYFFNKKLNIGMFVPSGSKIDEVFHYIDALYVDSVDREELTEIAIEEMLTSLDPHSSYANAEQNKMLEESMNGSFDGIGIQFNILNDTVRVVATIAGGPSERLGLRAGDAIMTVDTTNVAGIGITNEKIFKMLRGKKGTVVEVTVKRREVTQPITFEIIRDVIPTYTINCYYMITPEIGLIKIDHFSNTTGDEFREALADLQERGMEKMILDLRGNPGGLLNTALEVCDQLFEKDQLIVYTEGLNTTTDEYYTSFRGLFKTGALVVLIDDFSASASEIIAGAVQDHDRGWIVGRPSFGKGLVQRHLTLNDNSSIRLTTARYHTPSGRCIQRDYNKGIDEYYNNIADQYVSDSIVLDTNNKEKFTTKKGRVVYGGGGIYPDYVITDNHEKFSNDYYLLLNSSALIDFCFNYTLENKKNIQEKYPTAEAFVNNMNISNSIVDQYLNLFYAKNNETERIALTDTEIDELKMWLKALIGRNIFKENGFNPVLNKENDMVIKALEILDK